MSDSFLKFLASIAIFFALISVGFFLGRYDCAETIPILFIIITLVLSIILQYLTISNFVFHRNNILETKSICSTFDKEDGNKDDTLVKDELQEVSKRVKPDNLEYPKSEKEDVTENSIIPVQGEPERIRLLTNTDKVIGISYKGDGHIKSKMPCQDCHGFAQVNKVWNVAVVSDGAGSAANSQNGSSAVCSAFLYYMKELLTSEAYSDGTIPDSVTWDREFRAYLIRFQKELKSLATSQNFDYKSLAATIIVFAYSPKGYIVAHVGDGRASVKINGEWKAIITPHKGEEANQTIFCTTIDFGEYPNLQMSGVYVPETSVSTALIEQFVLMTDGCEMGLWQMSERIELPNNDFKFESRNIPFAKGLEAAAEILSYPKEKRNTLIMSFVVGYNKYLLREPDDKTFIIGKI